MAKKLLRRDQVSKRSIDDGFRRILYDAMVLSASLRSIRDCHYYTHWRIANVDGFVEAHQANALIQVRSMIDFLTCGNSSHSDTMMAVQFFGCEAQDWDFEERRAANKYAAHKSWDAVAKNAHAGARQLSKKEVVELGLRVLEAFGEFRKQCDSNLHPKRNENAKTYEKILNENLAYLRSRGV